MPLDLAELRLISAYLNAVAVKVAGGTLNLRWLTGKASDELTGLTADAAHQETQCISFGGTLWVANNGDDDSDVQRAFLNWAGISTPGPLLSHAKNHGIMAMPFHMGAPRVTGAMTDEQKVLHAALLATGGTVVANPFTSGGTSACADFKLTSVGAPGRGAVIFVTEDYRCDDDGGASCHAEQKLLAASGRLHAGKTTYVPARVGGLKPPCKTCREVLDVVVPTKMPGLQFDTTQGRQNVVSIKKLDVSHYFPAPGPATGIATGLCAVCGVADGTLQQYCAHVPTHTVPICYNRDCLNASSKSDWKCAAHR